MKTQNSRNILAFILTPVSLAVLGEFLLKISVTGKVFPSGFHGFLAMVSNLGVLGGVALIAISALLWIVGLSKFEISFMYPFLSLNYLTILLGAHFVLGEQVKPQRYLAMVLIIIGIFFISRSPYANSK